MPLNPSNLPCLRFGRRNHRSIGVRCRPQPNGRPPPPSFPAPDVGRRCGGGDGFAPPCHGVHALDDRRPLRRHRRLRRRVLPAFARLLDKRRRGGRPRWRGSCRRRRRRRRAAESPGTRMTKVADGARGHSAHLVLCRHASVAPCPLLVCNFIVLSYYMPCGTVPFSRARLRARGGVRDERCGRQPHPRSTPCPLPAHGALAPEAETKSRKSPAC